MPIAALAAPDEVALRSGVAKRTIYLHWQSRERLVLDACASLGAEQLTLDAGNLLGDLNAKLTVVAEMLRAARVTSAPGQVSASAVSTPMWCRRVGMRATG